jgi:hypothetical protein
MEIANNTENGHNNGHNGALTKELPPGQTLGLKVPQPLPVRTFASSLPRASLATLDAFRTLALTIESLLDDLPIRSIAILSAAPGEGRTLSAELLSLAFSELCPPVRLIDADPFQHAVRKPHLGPLHVRRGGPRVEPPSENGHAKHASKSSGVVPAFGRLPVGRGSYPGPAAFLDDVKREIDAAVAMRAQAFVDAPACSMSSLGFSVAQMVDAVIYVVRPQASALETHQEVLAQLALLKVNVLGILLNEG